MALIMKISLLFACVASICAHPVDPVNDAVPRLTISEIAAIGANSVYVKWNSDNDLDSVVKIQYTKKGAEQWQDYSGRISRVNGGEVLEELENGTEYKFRIVASNTVGDSLPAYSEWVRTLERDIDFVPEMSIVSKTSCSITLRVSRPPRELEDIIPYYSVVANAFEETHVDRDTSLSEIHVLRHLNPKTSYKIVATACNRYTLQCGNSSTEQEVTTLDVGVEDSSTNSSQCEEDSQ